MAQQDIQHCLPDVFFKFMSQHCKHYAAIPSLHSSVLQLDIDILLCMAQQHIRQLQVLTKQLFYSEKCWLQVKSFSWIIIMGYFYIRPESCSCPMCCCAMHSSTLDSCIIQHCQIYHIHTQLFFEKKKLQLLCIAQQDSQHCHSYPAGYLYPAVHGTAAQRTAAAMLKSVLLPTKSIIIIQHCHYYPALLAMLQQC
jgi:hypothetical protein